MKIHFRTIHFLVVALICTAAVGVGATRRNRVDVHVFTPQNLALGNPMPGCRAVNTFDVYDLDGLAGTRLGRATACIKREVTECGEPPLLPPFTAGCRQRVGLEITFKFCPGPLCKTGKETLTFRTVFNEIFSGPFSLVNIANGRVKEGTGAFRGEHGTLEGAGSTTFTPTGIDTSIVWVVRLSDEDDFDDDRF